MKRVLLLTAVLCLFIAGCTGIEESNLSLYGNPESDGVFGVRAGTELWENLEIGASANYRDGQDEINKTYRRHRRKEGSRKKTVRIQDEIDDWSYGTHIIRHFPIGSINPYVGAQATIGEGTFDIGNTIQPIGGVQIPVSDNFSIFGEYQQETTADEQRKFLIGLRIGF